MQVQTLKGFRDFLPSEAKKRQHVITTLKSVFESFGFEPLETPALEYEELLMGKYGDEGDKLMYRFTDNGERRVALRYDQTVPLSRVVAQYGSASSPQGQPLLPMPFKRYQIQPVWRAENTQKGRFREFLQCDIDTVGTNSTLADAEILDIVYLSLKKLGFSKFKIKFNDRRILFQKIREAGVSDQLALSAIRSIDKINKIGWKNVVDDLIQNGIETDSAKSLETLLAITQPIEGLEMQQIWEYSSILGIPSGFLQWDLTLARGLDYYTGLIFEVEVEGYSAGSVCGGGRYDNLIGTFANRDIPAVGCAFGFDRIIEAMNEFSLFPSEISSTKVLVTVFSPELKENSIEISSRLRSNNINCELYLDENAKMEKQLKYADQKNIPYVVIIGENEMQKNTVTVKNMETREQIELSLSDLPEHLASK